MKPAARINMQDLKPDMCKWPVGDPQETGFHFCGIRHREDGVYCPAHLNLAYGRDGDGKKLKYSRSSGKR